VVGIYLFIVVFYTFKLPKKKKKIPSKFIYQYITIFRTEASHLPLFSQNFKRDNNSTFKAHINEVRIIANWHYQSLGIL